MITKKASKKATKVIKKPSKKINFNSLNWIKDETGGKTYDFSKNETFTGLYLRSETKESKDKKGKKTTYTVNIFEDENGNEVSLPNNYQISQAIEKHGECYYRITFTEKKRLKGGHSVSLFDIETAKV